MLQEEIAARNATCQPARERHEELASAYRLRTRLIVAFPTIVRNAAPEESREHEIA
jgi:hypothetical protein